MKTRKDHKSNYLTFKNTHCSLECITKQHCTYVLFLAIHKTKFVNKTTSDVDYFVICIFRKHPRHYKCHFHILCKQILKITSILIFIRTPCSFQCLNVSTINDTSFIVENILQFHSRPTLQNFPFSKKKIVNLAQLIVTDAWQIVSKD